jgi:preprotein translocase subunit SecG
MYGFLLALHILVCLSLVLVILLQSGKGGGLAGGAFGGTAQTVFGGRGATDFLTRATMVLGGAFFLTSLVLSLMSSGTRAPSKSLIQEEARRALPSAPQQGAPGAPTQPGTTPPSGGTAPPSGGTTPPAGGGGTQPTPTAPPGGGR